MVKAASQTFDDLFSFACGYMKLEKDYFWSLTPAEFALILRGHTKRSEEDQMLALYNTRTIAYYSMVPHVKDIPSIEKFMPLPIDELIKKDKKPKAQHPWSNLSEKELKEKFGD